MIQPILRAAQALASPVIVQISQKDMTRCGVAVTHFAEVFFRSLQEEQVTVPVALHLDHTEDPALIDCAIAVGFSSVMIDASHLPLAENIAATSAVVERGHRSGVSVEGELGIIGAYSFSETDESSQVSYTDPDEAEQFIWETGVDALAVSVGTVHGTRTGSATPVDLARLAAIRARTKVPLVLHGGSGVSAEVLNAAVRLPGGGVSKVNLATDLERAMLAALGSKERLVDAQIEALDAEALARARAAVERVTREKISYFLLSQGQAGALS
jgi:fructose-bisphosphate aldolase class II